MGRDVIVVGASAGGLEALVETVRGLPADLPAALFVVCHVPADSDSFLPQILARRGPLPAGHARDGEPVRPGHIYVAPPDYHLLLQPGRVQLSHGPRENRHRPAADPLFRSAARAYGPRVVGVVLSGALSDGAAGLLAVRSAGGLAVVQDPDEAAVPGMPQAALAVAGADHVVSARALATLLVEQARQAPPPRRAGGGGGPQPDLPGGAPPMTDPIDQMPQTVERDFNAQQGGQRRGELSVFSCPECGGVMWQVNDPQLVRFRCHLGHAYYGERLLGEQAEALEAALWTAVRIFRERTSLSRQLAAKEAIKGDAEAAARFEEQARQAQRYGELIHQYLLSGPGRGPGTPGPTGGAP